MGIIQRIQADGSTQAGTYSCRDGGGQRQLVVYKYLKDRGWVFMVRDSAAEGSLTVNVTRNASYYIGDFRVLSESLKSIHANLANVIRDISQAARQVDSSADGVSTGAQALLQGTLEQARTLNTLISRFRSLNPIITDSVLSFLPKSPQI